MNLNPSRNNDERGCLAIAIAVVVAAVIVIVVAAAVTAAFQWLDANIGFFLALFGFVASLILIGEAFAFLRRKTARTEPEEIRAQLDQLRHELDLIQRQTGIYDEEAEAALRREPPDENEIG